MVVTCPEWAWTDVDGHSMECDRQAGHDGAHETHLNLDSHTRSVGRPTVISWQAR